MVGFYLFLLAAASADGDGLQDSDFDSGESLQEQIAAINQKAHQQLAVLFQHKLPEEAKPSSLAQIKDKDLGLPPLHLNLDERRDSELFTMENEQALTDKLAKIERKEDKIVDKDADEARAVKHEWKDFVKQETMKAEHGSLLQTPASSLIQKPASSLIQERELPSLDEFRAEGKRMQKSEDKLRAELDGMRQQAQDIDLEAKQRAAKDARLREALEGADGAQPAAFLEDPEAEKKLPKIAEHDHKHHLEKFLTEDQDPEFTQWSEKDKGLEARIAGLRQTLGKEVNDHQGWPAPFSPSTPADPSSFAEEAAKSYVPQSPEQSAFEMDQAMAHMKQALQQVKQETISNLRMISGKGSAPSSLLQSGEGDVPKDLETMRKNLKAKLANIHNQWEGKLSQVLTNMKHRDEAPDLSSSFLETGAKSEIEAQFRAATQDQVVDPKFKAKLAHIDSAYNDITTKLDNVLNQAHALQHATASSLLQTGEPDVDQHLVPKDFTKPIKDQEASIDAAFSNLDKQLDTMQLASKKYAAKTEAFTQQNVVPASILEEGYRHHAHPAHSHHTHIPAHSHVHHHSSAVLSGGPRAPRNYKEWEKQGDDLRNPGRYEQPTAEQWARHASHHRGEPIGRLQGSLVHQHSYAKELASKVAAEAENGAEEAVSAGEKNAKHLQDLVRGSWQSLQQELNTVNAHTMSDLDKIVHPNYKIDPKYAGKMNVFGQKKQPGAHPHVGTMEAFASRPDPAESLLEGSAVDIVNPIPGVNSLQVDQAFSNLDEKMNEIKDKAQATLEAINREAGVHYVFGKSDASSLLESFNKFRRRARSSLLQGPPPTDVKPLKLDIKHAFDDLNADIDAMNAKTAERLKQDEQEFPDQDPMSDPEPSSFVEGRLSPFLRSSKDDLVLPAGYSFEDLDQRLNKFDAKAKAEYEEASEGELGHRYRPESLLQGQRLPEGVRAGDRVERSERDRDLADARQRIAADQESVASKMSDIKSLELRAEQMLKGARPPPAALVEARRIPEPHELPTSSLANGDDEPQQDDESDEAPPVPESGEEKQDEKDEADAEAALQSDLKRADAAAKADEEKEATVDADTEREFGARERSIEQKEQAVQDQVNKMMASSASRVSEKLEDKVDEANHGVKKVLDEPEPPFPKGVRPGAESLLEGSYMQNIMPGNPLEQDVVKAASKLEDKYMSTFQAGYKDGVQREEAAELQQSGPSESFIERQPAHPEAFPEIESVKKELAAFRDSLDEPHLRNH